MTSDPVDELLRGFRADVPEPDAVQRARALALARRAAPRRRRRLGVALAVAGAAAAAVVLALVVPGHRQASAATILDRVAAATAPPQSGILHLRYDTVGVPFAGAGKTIRVTVESWRELGGRHRSRTVSGAIVPPATVEIYGGGGSLRLYDPRTNGLYDLAGRSVLSLGPLSSVGAFADGGSTLRDQLESGSVADVWQVTRTQLDGRDVYRIERRTPVDGFGVRSIYVDAQTYVPVRIDETSFPKDQRGGPFTQPPRGFFMGKDYPPSVTVTTIETYETLPDDPEHVALLDPAQVHPDAREHPVSELPADVAARVVGSGTRSPTPPSAAPTNVRRLVVDPLAGTIGSFRIGDNLLAVSRLVPPPFDSFQPLPGNLQDAMLAGHADEAGALVVTFRDGGEQHSTSVYLNRPFQTPRGDVNGPAGTTLAEFLGRWPEHAAPSKAGERTTVVVGQARFFFGGDDRLVAVQVGEGDAADYETFVRPR